jgi:hypothetical protein
MRDLYLHVGPQKTGSTYLHRLLVVNAGLLAEAGLGFAPYYDPAVGDHQGRFIPALRARGVAAVMAETAACEARTLLVTDEDLAKFLVEPAGEGACQAHALAAAARRHFRPRIVYFARRQDHLAESHFAQGAKTWYCGRPADYPPQDYDHDATLRALEAAFGFENVTVRLYRDGEPNDIAGAFFTAIGLDAVLPRLTREVGRQNVSMHRRKALLLAQVPKNRRGRPSWLNPPGLDQLIVQTVAASRAIAEDGVRGILSPGERRALVARYLDGNRALVTRHRIADPGAFVELPAPDPAWTPPAPVTAAELAAIFREAVAAAWAGRGPRAALDTARLSGLFTRIAARARAGRA